MFRCGFYFDATALKFQFCKQEVKTLEFAQDEQVFSCTCCKSSLSEKRKMNTGTKIQGLVSCKVVHSLFWGLNTL